jgi:hypothetical protein
VGGTNRFQSRYQKAQRILFGVAHLRREVKSLNLRTSARVAGQHKELGRVARYLNLRSKSQDGGSPRFPRQLEMSTVSRGRKSSPATSVSIQAFGNPGRGRPTMGGSRSRDADMHAVCWLRRPGQRRERQVPCELFSFWCGPGGSACGGCRDGAQAGHPGLASALRRMRAISWRVQRYMPGNCAISNSRPGINRRAGGRGRPMPTISAVIASRSGASSSRPRQRIPASSPAGTHEDPSQQPRRAQAPHGKGCAAGLSPLALLFATRSPE